MAILQRERKDEQVASVVSGLRALSENAQGQTPPRTSPCGQDLFEDYDGGPADHCRPERPGGRGTPIEDPATMENHGDREEIAEAKESGVGVSERWSDTLKGRLRYVAVQADNGYIYRRLGAGEKSQPGLCEHPPGGDHAASSPAVLFSALGAKSVAKKIARPVEEIVEGLQNIDNGDYSRLTLPDCDELASLVVSINTLSENIDHTLKDLRGERQKTLFLLDNVQEGLLALDKDTRVITVNRAAAAFLQVPPGRVAGQTISHLTTNKALIDAVLAAVEGPESLGSAFDLDDREGEKALLCSVLPVQADWIEGERGAIVVLRDVTEERRRQQMRSEFFQNASHELKTPITSIGGFAQLLQSGMVTEEETRQRYLHNIEKETGRMAELIGDILKISRYEEGEVPRNEQVDLAALAGEVMERLQPVADRQGISLEMEQSGRRPAALGLQKGHGGPDRQPLRQCRQVQPPRWLGAGAAHRPARRGADRGGGHRRRYPRRPPEPGVRAVLPGGEGPEQKGGGDRPGAGHRQAHLRPLRRPGGHPERRGQGDSCHCGPPAGAVNRGRCLDALFQENRQGRRKLLACPDGVTRHGTFPSRCSAARRSSWSGFILTARGYQDGASKGRTSLPAIDKKQGAKSLAARRIFGPLSWRRSVFCGGWLWR